MSEQAVDPAFTRALLSALTKSKNDPEYIALAEKLLNKKMDSVRYHAKVAQLQHARQLWGGSENQPFWPWHSGHHRFKAPPEVTSDNQDPRYRVRRVPKPPRGSNEDERNQAEFAARLVRDENAKVRVGREAEVWDIEWARSETCREIRRWECALSLEMIACDMLQSEGTNVDEAREKVQRVLSKVLVASRSWDGETFRVETQATLADDRDELNAVFDDRTCAQPKENDDARG